MQFNSVLRSSGVLYYALVENEKSDTYYQYFPKNYQSLITQNKAVLIVGSSFILGFSGSQEIFPDKLLREFLVKNKVAEKDIYFEDKVKCGKNEFKNVCFYRISHKIGMKVIDKFLASLKFQEIE